MLKKMIRLVGGDPNKREIEKLSDIVNQINGYESQFESFSDDALRAKSDEFRAQIRDALTGIESEEESQQVEQEILNEIMPEAFAIVREASKRALGLRHYDVQMIGGIVLHQGRIAEMRTGEGKTLVATLPIYLNALTGRGVHLITVNDYLARRDARWMAPIYNLLGLSIGVLQMAARTENGKKAFIVELERESPHEDQNQLRMAPRAEAYLADITYGTNSEFGFDYLRDNMTMNLADRVQRGHYYAIIDEVDNVLIDEARTPLIISGPAQDEGEWYIRVAQVAKALRPEDYEVEEKDRTVTLTELGEAHVEELLNMPLRDPDRPEDLTLEQERIMGYLEQALRAQFLYRRNKEYLIQAGKVIIIDEFTGRMMPGRRWSDGLHQAVEAKEGVKVQSESVTYATITIQNYFRMYQKLAGMSGTAVTESEEFDKIYTLSVLAIPTNLEYQAMQPNSDFEELEAKDEQNYKYQYYARKNNSEKYPIFWRRKDFPDVVYRTVETKLRSISGEILTQHTLGRPILVGTTSVENSERLSNRLRAEPLRRLAQTMLLRHTWISRNDYLEDGRQIAELQFLNIPLEELDLNQMRQLARELEIPFVPEDPSNLARLLQIMELPADLSPRLQSCLQAGIPHQVLNARKHTEESQIIATAGSFGAVTIATNMAGRGVDIKLGGDLAEEIIAVVNRVLSRTQHTTAYEMTHLERKHALLQMDREAYGIYEAEIDYFFKYLEEMEQVRALGGLHVIGSERHEARRIDNQLRGRAARQGDPGSSRFFLSMEDDLMRLFGGQQADNMMQRLKIDEALPLEMALVSRLIEQSQTRVEGANFDVRKHLLEYDDVLNAQRARIYAERNRVFRKTDLTDDVLTMLRTELANRVTEALKDQDTPWRLLAWLDQIQPSITVNGRIFPSFTLKLLAEEINQHLPASPTAADLQQTLLEIATSALQAENAHLLESLEFTLEQNIERLEIQIKERQDALEMFFEGLDLSIEEGEPRKLAEIQTELSALAKIPLKLTNEQQRVLRDHPKQIAPNILETVISATRQQSAARLVGSIQVRLGEELDLRPDQLDISHDASFKNQVLESAEIALKMRQDRLVGENGQIGKDLENLLSKLSPPYSDHEIFWLLTQMTQGSKSVFDRRTHRKMVQRTSRLTYTYSAARLIEDLRSDDIAEMVLQHLVEAQSAFSLAWGEVEFKRLSNFSLADLEQKTRSELLAALDQEESSPLQNLTLESLDSEQRSILVDEFGKRVLSNIYRQLLLGIITELWVDYLTQMELLRVSIGLEAYAQRDPLVQYKSRASELFRTLQSNIRLGVISRMFTYQPRDLSQIVTGTAQTELEEDSLRQSPEFSEPIAEPSDIGEPGSNSSSNEEKPQSETSTKKRRRRRR